MLGKVWATVAEERDKVGRIGGLGRNPQTLKASVKYEHILSHFDEEMCQFVQSSRVISS